MRLLDPQQRETLAARFGPERPGPQVGLHVLRTGHGACFADRWPDPRVLLSACGGNYSLTGDPGALDRDGLEDRISGLLDAPAEFEPLLRDTDPCLQHWPRRILDLEGPGLGRPDPAGVQRRLGPEDVHHVFGLTSDNGWISATWGGPYALCAGRVAWGAFVDDRLVSLAVPFYVGDRYEDIGVVTEPGFRGNGLSAACAGSLVADVLARGRRPSWSTSPDNLASLRVAEKLGFVLAREDQLYVIRAEIPEPPGRDR